MSIPSIHNEINRPLPLQEGLADEAERGSSASLHGKGKDGFAFDQATKGDLGASNAPMNYPHEQQASESNLGAHPIAEDPEDEAPYPERSAHELVHPPDFKPLFTLIEDPETSEYHHPTVHYIFSDDDPEILTNATLNALQAHGDLERSEGSRDDDDGAQMQEEPEERYVVLDMEADGKIVASASSLSSEWQVLKTSVTQAPSWGDAGNDKADGKLLLKISGQESRSAVKARSRQQQQQQQQMQKSEMSLDELVKMFGNRLDGLDQVMDRPEKTDDESKMT